MKAIQIDNPCHEDWSEMNPTKRGAFCQKCSVDVYDFSSMQLHEIKRALKENEDQHLCGRFDANQLELLNREFELWKLNQPRSFQSRFVFALLLVFGLTLFSCAEEDLRQMAKLNAVELKSALNQADETLANQLFWVQDAIIANEMLQTPDPQENIESIKMGKFTYVEHEKLVAPLPPEFTVMVAGGPMIDHSYYEYLEQTLDSVAETTLPDPPVSTTNPFEAKVYPNPTRDQATCTIYIHQSAQFQIDIYSISGQKTDEIHQGELTEGTHQFDLNLTEYKPGTYLIKISSGLQQETVKILKVE